MKETLINNPVSELFNSLFNVKEKMTSAEWVEISTLLMKVHQMKTIIKWKSEPCDCCESSESDSNSDTDSDND